MPSNINPLNPTAGNATTQSVRENFSAAKTEIEALQTDKAEALALAAHVVDNANPHQTTAAQVGAPTSAAFNDDVAALAAHTADMDNPHGVTPAQIGAPDGDSWNILVANFAAHETEKADAHGIRKVRSITQVSSAQGFLAGAPELAFALTAEVLYAFKFWVVFQTSTINCGILLSVEAPNASLLVFHVETPTSLSAKANSNQRAQNGGAATTGIDTANANTLATIEGVVSLSVDGALMVRFMPEAGAGTARIMPGSCGILYEVP